MAVLEYVIGGVNLNAQTLEESLPPGSAFTILLRMVSAFIIADFKEGKKVLVA